MFAMAEAPGAWEAPTACSDWQVPRHHRSHWSTHRVVTSVIRDRPAGGSAECGIGLPVMHELAGDGGRAFRGVPQAEMMGRIRSDLDKMMASWSAQRRGVGRLMVPHVYMGRCRPSFTRAAS